MRRGYDDERGAGGYRDAPAPRGRGVPDSLLVGLLAFLLGLTVLVWSATGLAGFFAHGAWPTGVTYPGTPMALRHLVSAPHNMAAAWPDTPKDQLSGYGLFWGILIGELMVLLVLAIFTLGTITRYRAVRTARRSKARQPTAPEPAAHTPQEQARQAEREAWQAREALQETAAPTAPGEDTRPAPAIPATPPPSPAEATSTGPLPEQRTSPPA
ncbi:type VI secretion protein, partial [Streptomyces sioyaensis]